MVLGPVCGTIPASHCPGRFTVPGLGAGFDVPWHVALRGPVNAFAGPLAMVTRIWIGRSGS